MLDVIMNHVISVWLVLLDDSHPINPFCMTLLNEVLSKTLFFKVMIETFRVIQQKGYRVSFPRKTITTVQHTFGTTALQQVQPRRAP